MGTLYTSKTNNLKMMSIKFQITMYHTKHVNKMYHSEHKQVAKVRVNPTLSTLALIHISRSQKYHLQKKYPISIDQHFTCVPPFTLNQKVVIQGSTVNHKNQYQYHIAHHTSVYMHFNLTLNNQSGTQFINSHPNISSYDNINCPQSALGIITDDEIWNSYIPFSSQLHA